MKQISRQYVMSVYDDGSVRVTEHALPKRGCRGHFIGNNEGRARKAADGFERFFVLAKPID